MNKILLFLYMITISISFGQSTNLDQTIELITEKLLLNKDIDNNQIVAIGNFPIQKNKITDMSYYLAKKIYFNISNRGKFSAIEQDKVNYALDKTERDYESFIDYNYLAKLGENIFKVTGLAPQLYIFGSLTDLNDKILVKCKLISAGTAKTISETETEITATAFTDKLLGKKVTHKSEIESTNRIDTVIVEREKIVEVPVIQEKIIEKIVEVPVVVEDIDDVEKINPDNDQEIFFQEDFSKYGNGDPVSEWGENLIAIERNDHRKYLTSQVRGVHSASKKINFPNNFSFQFEYLKGDFSSEIILIDSEDQQLRIILNQYYKSSVVFPNTVEKSTKTKDINEFRLVKNGNTYKAYINGDFLLSYVDKKFKDFIMFKMKIPEGRYFTNFIGKRME